MSTFSKGDRIEYVGGDPKATTTDLIGKVGTVFETDSDEDGDWAQIDWDHGNHSMRAVLVSNIRMVEPEWVVGQQVSGTDYERLPLGSEVKYGDVNVFVRTKVAPNRWKRNDRNAGYSDNAGMALVIATLTHLPEHAEPEDATDAYVEPEPLKEGEDDERIGAWERLAGHPIFKPCYAEERTLIDAMMAKLDRIYSEGASPMRPEEPTTLGAVVYSESHAKFWTRASVDPDESHVWAGGYDKCWFNWRQLPDDVAVVDYNDFARGGAS